MTLQEADDLLRKKLARLHVNLDNPKLALLPVLNALQVYYRVEGNQYMTGAANRLLVELNDVTTAPIEARRLANYEARKEHVVLDGYYIKKVGQNKGKPRVWLDAQVAKAGMQAGQRYDVIVNGQTVVLQAKPPICESRFTLLAKDHASFLTLVLDTQNFAC